MAFCFSHSFSIFCTCNKLYAKTPLHFEEKILVKMVVLLAICRVDQVKEKNPVSWLQQETHHALKTLWNQRPAYL